MMSVDTNVLFAAVHVDAAARDPFARRRIFDVRLALGSSVRRMSLSWPRLVHASAVGLALLGMSPCDLEVCARGQLLRPTPDGLVAASLGRERILLVPDAGTWTFMAGDRRPWQITPPPTSRCRVAELALRDMSKVPDRPTPDYLTTKRPKAPCRRGPVWSSVVPPLEGYQVVSDGRDTWYFSADGWHLEIDADYCEVERRLWHLQPFPPGYFDPPAAPRGPGEPGVTDPLDRR